VFAVHKAAGPIPTQDPLTGAANYACHLKDAGAQYAPSPSRTLEEFRNEARNSGVPQQSAM